MPETTPTCQIHEKYPSFKCANPALDGDPDGYCILHSQNRDKDPEAFREAVLPRWTQADKEFYDFRGVFFPGRFRLLYFLDREFTKPIFFSRAIIVGVTFTKKADFGGATFTEEANFEKVNFTEEASFSGATFKKEAYFPAATFTEKASFFNATFAQKADFSGATFREHADFSGAKIFGRVVFQALNPSEEGKPPPPAFQANFQWLELGPEAMLRFQDLSLAQVKFRRSDLRRVEFHHVQWHPYRGRQAIYDEVLLRQEEKKKPWLWNWLLYDAPYADPPSLWTDRYGEVERLYRDLQENYEKARDYKKMGDFHYGEMEMHRRASKWGWFPCYWYKFYWFLSGYGERPSRALGWLAGFLLALPLLVWGFGLDITPGKAIHGFLETFTYIFEKATFQRPPLLSNLNLLGSFISNLSLLIIPGQAALFLLALRNRLGRRR
jgi:uncharacterized protein YjbI with pentapeptide repeats